MAFPDDVHCGVERKRAASVEAEIPVSLTAFRQSQTEHRRRSMVNLPRFTVLSILQSYNSIEQTTNPAATTC
ncbi:hypothetical protein PBRA_000210 [Plasmodiophora brassicae]|uniref:Uncharacterized protein n=1 Tax=Plasmodiophora brassicae TaxID=37360 RepID=A0A0G4IH47_PLABS|nr:hypothetical protein PBRA_000210 [Plasmodiophora brassicae]